MNKVRKSVWYAVICIKVMLGGTAKVGRSGSAKVGRSCWLTR